MLPPAGLQQCLLSSLLGRRVVVPNTALAGDRGSHVAQAGRGQRCRIMAQSHTIDQPWTSDRLGCWSAHLQEGCQLSLAGLLQLGHGQLAPRDHQGLQGLQTWPGAIHPRLRRR